MSRRNKTTCAKEREREREIVSEREREEEREGEKERGSRCSKKSCKKNLQTRTPVVF